MDAQQSVFPQPFQTCFVNWMQVVRETIEGLGILERRPKLTGMVMCRATRKVKDKTSAEDRSFITSHTGIVPAKQLENFHAAPQPP